MTKQGVCLLVLLCLSCIRVSQLYAQNGLSNFSFEISTQKAVVKIPGADTLYQIKCTVNLTNIDSLNYIHIKCGSQEFGNDIFEYTFNYRGLNNLPDGVSILKRDNCVILLLGYFPSFSYYYSMWLESENSSLTPIISNHP